MNTKHTRSFHMALLMAAATATCLVGLSRPSAAILVQPYNYLLDDSAMVGAPDASASLSPYLNEQHEASADKDIAGIIGDSLARLRWARMLDGQQSAVANQQAADEAGHLSQEMAELIRSEQDQQAKQEGGPDQQTLSSSVASMILNVAQAAAAAASSGSVDEAHQPQGEAPLQAEQQASSSSSGAQPSHLMSSRGSIMELDTSAGSPSAASMASKADLKVGPTQWFNPKETIPVLKISAMATPSKYKKVYFRSEKKLVDGAFHSPAGEHTGHGEAKKQPLVKAFQSSGANVQRRSSRGTSSSVPPSILQDGVIDFLRKFRDVYVQTRPAGSAQSSSSSAASNVASMVAAAASSPFASIMSPSGGSGGSRPNLASALSAASSMMNSAAMLSQAASSSVPASSSLAASTSGASSAGAATGASGAAAGSPAKSPLTPQSYVSFWSKTFPTWVRKMLKQMRRRSLHNSSKRQQHQHHNHHGGHQKIASGAVSSVVDSSSGSSSSSSSSSSGSSSSSSSSR